MQLEPLDTREIGKRLRTLRTNARMKQVELSSLLGIAQSTLSLYERGGIIPGFEILIPCKPGASSLSGRRRI